MPRAPSVTVSRIAPLCDHTSRCSPKGEKNLGGHPQTPVWGCPPPSPSPDAIRLLFRARVAPGLQQTPRTPQKREIGAPMTPGPATPRKERRIWGTPPDPRHGAAAPFTLARRQFACSSERGWPVASANAADSAEARDRRPYDPGPHHSPKEKGIWGTPPDPRYGAAAPFTLARRPRRSPKGERNPEDTPQTPMWDRRPLHPRQTPIRPKPKGGGHRPPPGFAFR
jgi:hypothetical protein